MTLFRNAHSSYLDIESKYNRLMEDKVLLDEELRVSKAAEEEVQRLKDALNGKLFPPSLVVKREPDLWNLADLRTNR